MHPNPCWNRLSAPKTMTLTYKVVPSSVGRLKLVAGTQGLRAILWENDAPGRVRLGPLLEDAAHPLLTRTERQLAEYFAGERTHFDVPLEFAGTEFQKRVWTALLDIPFGETRTYGELARQLGNSRAARAVGAANGRNPVSIITPCHRAIGADGSLTGFAGGLDAKRYLLALEARQRVLAA